LPAAGQEGGRHGRNEGRKQGKEGKKQEQIRKEGYQKEHFTLKRTETVQHILKECICIYVYMYSQLDMRLI
jgi:hypothetical protein